MEEITYEVDNIIIAGNYWRGTNAKAIILLHMMPATKESFHEFAEKIHDRGWSVLAIDLRGHGKSTQKIVGNGIIPIDYREFTDRQHQDSIRDVFGARDWLVQQGIPAAGISIGGASIGANLAIKYMGENPECDFGFALSAGLNYRGIKTLATVEALSPKQHIYFVAAKDDDNVPHAIEYAEDLYDAASASKRLRIYEIGGHGTDIFATHPALMDEIISWASPRYNWRETGGEVVKKV